MKKWMNTLFFGSCFIAAILIEAFSIKILDGNLFIATALGVVILIMGYLFMDSIRNNFQKENQDIKLYIDQLMKVEADRWNERYTELLNVQKATYTATKKNTTLLTKQFDDVLFKIETLEDINAKAQHKIMELQKKALEGQKNALNLEINHNRDNTKQILEALREEDRNKELKDQLNSIITLLELNSDLLKDNKDCLETVDKNLKLVQQAKPVTAFKDYEDEIKNNTVVSNKVALDEADVDADSYNDNYIITDDLINGMEINMYPENLDDSEDLQFNDLNNYMNTDALADNYADESYNEENVSDSSKDFLSALDEEITGKKDDSTRYQDDLYQKEVSNNIDNINAANINVNDMMSQEDLDTLLKGLNADMNPSDQTEDTIPDNNKAPESDWSYSEESEPEADNSAMLMEELEKPKVIPLYDDPNKALTADEIAALFASFGQ